MKVKSWENFGAKLAEHSILRIVLQPIAKSPMLIISSFRRWQNLHYPVEARPRRRPGGVRIADALMPTFFPRAGPSLGGWQATAARSLSEDYAK